MNLSKLNEEKVVKIKDPQNPDQILVHTFRPFRTEDRINLNRSISKMSGVDQKDLLSGAKKVDQADIFAGSYLASCELWDSMIVKVEGYTITMDDQEVDVMRHDDWKSMIPSDHKQAAIQDVVPNPEVLKN